MNKVFLIGNLTRDPELSETNSGGDSDDYAAPSSPRKKPALEPFDDDGDIPF